MRRSHEEIAQEFERAKEHVVVGGVYVHYKRPERYQVLDLAWLTETEEAGVVYKALYGSGITFIRPVRSWLEDVVTGETRLKRFTIDHFYSPGQTRTP